MRPPDSDTTTARLSRTAEQLSILGHELAAATAAVWDGLRPEPGWEQDAAAIATILQSTSDRMREHVLSLIEITYAQNEEAIAMSGDPRAERCAVAMGRISRQLEPVLELAQELAGQLRAVHSIGAARGRGLRAADLAVLDRPICDLLETTPTATGAGVAIAPNLLEDRELWMQWWVDGSGTPKPLHFEFDPGHARYYDYREAVWYRDAARELTTQLADPHFDEGGTDRYMITGTTPAIVNTIYLGLGCAELTLEHLHQLIDPALTMLNVPAALITPSGLIVASTDPLLQPPDPAPDPLLHAISTSANEPFAEIATDTTVARSNTIPWQLLCRWPKPRP